MGAVGHGLACHAVEVWVWGEKMDGGWNRNGSPPGKNYLGKPVVLLSMSSTKNMG